MGRVQSGLDEECGSENPPGHCDSQSISKGLESRTAKRRMKETKTTKGKKQWPIGSSGK